jgi:putative endonuclease
MGLARKFHYVYLLQNESGDWYTGCTSDLRKRLREHSDGKSEYTKHCRTYKLVYFEACLNNKDAYRRERYLKSGMGKRYLRNRLKLQLEGERDESR